jgi:hypothetical protein
MFQTFLLDKGNKVLAIGNPVHNPKVKELYLKIIQGEKIGRGGENKVIRTKVAIDRTSVSLGSFDWQEEQKVTFILENVGDKPLVIQDVHYVLWLHYRNLSQRAGIAGQGGGFGSGL